MVAVRVVSSLRNRDLEGRFIRSHSAGRLGGMVGEYGAILCSTLIQATVANEYTPSDLAQAAFVQVGLELVVDAFCLSIEHAFGLQVDAWITNHRDVWNCVIATTGSTCTVLVIGSYVMTNYTSN